MSRIEEKAPNIKLIALDLDGTTLTRAGLTRRTKETLEEAIKRGIEVVIATGRPFVALPEEVLAIKGLKYIIISNGGHICDTKGNILYSSCADPNAMRRIRKIVMEENVPVEVFYGGGAFVDEKLYEDLKINGSTFMGAKYIIRTRKPVKSIYDFWEEHIDEIENINLHYEFQEDRLRMKELFEKMNDITVTSSQHNNLELVGKNTSKASALKHLCEILNIDMNDALAAGDSPNDGDMLREVGLSVAVGNALDEIKEIADFIAPSNEDEGVCYTIHKYIFKDLTRTQRREAKRRKKDDL